MYFSRIRVNQKNAGNVQWVKLIKGDIYNTHQLLWKLFPHSKSRSFLFRQEWNQKILENDGVSQSRNTPTFYMVSVDPPQNIANLFFIETKNYVPSLSVGQIFTFDLRANPVVTIRKEGKKNPSHHDVLMNTKKKATENNIASYNLWEHMEKAAVDWFSKRAPQWGFSIVPGHLLVDGYQSHYLNKKHQENSIQFSTIDYSGILTIENPAQFQKTLFDGIGRAKAFGCGLMLIRPRIG